MTQRMKRQMPMLNALCHCKATEQKQIFKSAQPDLVKAICDCVTNVIHGRIPISHHQKRKIQHKKKVLRDLANPNKTTTAKKKLLVQHGSGIFSALLKPLIGTLFNL